jgi:hypothetical protein
MIRETRFGEAVPLLLPLLPTQPLARRLLLECYASQGDTLAIARDFYPPSSSGEVLYVADALWEQKDLPRLRKLLASKVVVSSTVPAVRDMRNKYLERLGK